MRSTAREGRASKRHPAQAKCKRHDRKRHQHQYPESIHVGEERRLHLYLLPDPGKGLLLCLGKRATGGGEVIGHMLEGVLILDARRNRILSKPALMELLAMRQDVRHKRDADRAARIAC